MNECPDIDLLIDLSVGAQEAEVALLEHTATCDRCRSDLEALGEIRTVLNPSREVPEELVARVMASLPDPPPEPEPAAGRPGWSPLDAGISWVLGTATVAASVVMGSPAGGSGTLLDLALFSAAVGVIVAIVEPRLFPGGTDHA